MNVLISSFSRHCLLGQSEDGGDKVRGKLAWMIWAPMDWHGSAWCSGKVGRALGRKWALKTVFLVLGIGLD